MVRRVAVLVPCVEVHLEFVEDESNHIQTLRPILVVFGVGVFNKRVGQCSVFLEGFINNNRNNMSE